jgi:hypothetical protein
MKEYVKYGFLKGEQRRLWILNPTPGVYQVYWDALFLGDIRPLQHVQYGMYWDTDSEILMPLCQEIGEYIESCDQ